MKKLKKSKGITLIALVITIVVILILAAISINLLFGENGLIAKAKEARDKTKDARDKELSEMDDALAFINSEKIRAGEDVEVKDIEDIDDSVNLPEKRSDSELIKLGYIPIYTTEQFKQIATETKGYQINDLQGNNKGKYDMNKNAKYAIINDIDFSDVTDFYGITEFRGELEGNGCIISNVTIDNTSGHVIPPPSTIFENDGIPYNFNAGIVCSADGATIQNIEIDNSNFKASDSAGTIVGKCDNTTINNCYAKNCNSEGGYNAGGIVGATWANKTTITNCKTINPNGKVTRSRPKFAGILSIAFGDIEITGCQTIVTDNDNLYEIDGMIYEINNQYFIPQNSDKKTEVKISDCKVQDLKQANSTKSENRGGIVCSIILNGEGNININNCTAKNIEGNNYCGIVAFLEGNVNINIDKCAIQNIQSNVKNGDFFGGLIGIVNKASKLNVTNCTGKKVILSGKSSIASGLIGGLFKTKNIDIKNCIIKDYENEKNFQCNVTGGIIGVAGDFSIDSVEKMNIENCIANNIKIMNEKSVSQAGGIVGIVQTRNTKSELTINNCITKEYSGTASSIGGIIGQTEFVENISVNNCSELNMNAIGRKVGGIIGQVLDGKEVVIKTCYADNCKISLKSIVNNNEFPYRGGAGIIRIVL